MSQEYSYFATSTAPRVQARPTEGGIIIDKRPSNQPTWAIISISILCMVLFTALLINVLTTRQNDWKSALVGSIFLLLIDCGFLVFAVWQGIRMYECRHPVLTLSQWPLQLGDTVQVRFQNHMRGVSIEAVQALITCTEHVSYHRETKNTKSPGTVTTFHTESSICWKERQQTIELRRDAAGVDAQWSFQLPLDLPPSFVCPSGSIEWTLDVVILNKTYGTNRSEFLLYVKPEVAN